MNCVISVLGKDKVGIVAGVACVLRDCHVNIYDINQTILADLFVMTALVTIDEKKCSFNEVLEKLQEEGERLGVQITFQREDVLDYMYKV